MNDNDKEQITKIIADKFDRKLKQFLAEKQIEVNKGGSDNQEIYHLDLKSEFESARQDIYQELNQAKHTDGIDQAIDALISDYINNYVYNFAINDVYSADALTIDDNYVLPVLFDASRDLAYQPIIKVEKVLKNAGYKVERNGSNLLAVENDKNQIILEVTQIAENKPDLKITLGDDGMDPYNIEALATEMNSKQELDDYITLLNVLKPFM